MKHCPHLLPCASFIGSGALAFAGPEAVGGVGVKKMDISIAAIALITCC